MKKIMSKKRVIIPGLVFLVGLGFILMPEITGPNLSQMTQAEFLIYLDQEIVRLQEDYQIPGLSLSLLKAGELIKAEAYGYADLKQQREMTLDTPCRVQSISKSLTAWGIMKLVEAGQLELDRPVVSYLNSWEMPQTEYPLEELTIRQLLTMTGGLELGTIGARYFPQEEVPTLQESLSLEVGMRQLPGEGFYYSNVSFNLLELVVEEVTGESFNTYMERKVLRPLGMNNSTFVWSQSISPAVPTGYDLQGRPVSLYVYPEKASGGLFATGVDIANFLRAGMAAPYLMEQTVLSQESIEQMHQPAVVVPGFYGLAYEAYGFGHYLETLSSGLKAVSHGGQGYGVMTHYHLFPETGDGIVILTNSQRSWPVIARILRSWTEWLEVGQLGMSRIITGGIVLQIIVLLIFLVILARIEGIVTAIKKGEYKVTFTWQKSLRYLFAAIIFIGLFLAARQDYLFLTSVFPIISLWLGYALAGLGLILLF